MNDTGSRLRKGSGSALLFGALCAGFFLQILLAWSLPAHVDEFRMLADVYLSQDRQLTSPILTFITHFFGWVLWLGDTELTQLAWARGLQFLLQIGTGCLVYVVARTRFSVAASLLAVLACISFSFVLHHGTSLRFDTPIAFVTLAAVVVLLRSKSGGVGTPVALVLVALALVLSIKSVLLLPMFTAFLGLRWLRSPSRGSETMMLVGGSAIAALLMWVALHWHSGYVVGNALGAATREARDGWWSTVVETGLFPRGRDAIRALIDNPVQIVLIVGGWWFLARSPASHETGRATSMPLWPLALPLLSLLFYRNAYTYFYVILVPLAGVGVAAWAERMRPRARGVLAVVMLLLASLHTFIFMKDAPMRARQETLLSIVHGIFPHPVPYIDCCSMLPSFPKHGFFMSHKGGDDYRRHGKPIMAALIERHQPVFVLGNHPWLLDAFVSVPEHARLLLPDDLTALRENYVHLDGQVYVAGFRVRVGPQALTRQVLVGGRYRLSSRIPVTVNGRSLAPGSGVDLTQGPIQLASLTEQDVVLQLDPGARFRRQRWPSGPLVPKL